MKFSDAFQDDLSLLMQWRRDVRRFRTDPVPDDVLTKCLDSLHSAPSVGLSQPWRLVDIASDTARAAARANFQTANAEALAGYSGDRAQLYSQLKLSGMDRAPIHWAVFCDDTTDQGARLGAKTMPEMRRYSVVCAVMQMWLTARAQGLGIGWVSILDPEALCQSLDINTGWHLVAYLCIGWPEEQTDEPELQRQGWSERAPLHMERK